MAASSTQPKRVSKLAAMLAVLISFALAAAIPSSLAAQDGGGSGPPQALGNPLADLQRQIDELKQRVSSLEAASPGVYRADVNCEAGETVSAALGQAPRGAGRVIFTIVGVCEEDVVISRRDSVTLQGASPQSGLRGSSPSSILLTLNGVHRIVLNRLTLAGGFFGLRATAGASFSAANLIVTGAANAGILVEQNATGTIQNLTLQDGSWSGIQTGTGGVVSVQGGEIKNHPAFGVFNDGGQVSLAGGVLLATNGIGVTVQNGGALNMQGVTVQDSSGFGVNVGAGFAMIRGADTLITRSDRAALNLAGDGAVWLSDGARVAGNYDDGVMVGNGSSLSMANGPVVEDNVGAGVRIVGASSALVTSGSEIRGNHSHGISIHDTSVATFFPPTDGVPMITNNDGFGIYCQGAPAVAQFWGSPQLNGNVSGNTNCP